MRQSLLYAALVALILVASGCSPGALPPGETGFEHLGVETDPATPAPVDETRAAGDSPVIFYVKTAPGGRADGSDWANAFGDLQAALDAVGGDRLYEIWVAAGTYVPSRDHTGDLTPLDPRTKTFQLQNGLTIYGGFPADANNSTGMADRDWQQHPTTLSGDLNRNGERDEDDAYHVFHHQEGLALDHTAVLDGFLITGGNASGPDHHGQGGGMRNDHNDPVLNNVTIASNYAVSGGGMHNVASSPHLYNVTIANNVAAEIGGGLSNDGSHPTLLESAIEGNDADLGGGIFNQHESSPTLTASAIVGNTASNDGGGMYSDSNSSAVLTDVMVTNNHARRLGGGLFNHAGSSPMLVNVVLSGNQADHTGGGLFNDHSDPSLTNVVISGNSAGVGAGMLNAASSPTLIHVTVSGNVATESGGGLASLHGSSPSIYNSIIWGNAAGAHPDVYNEDPESMPEFAHSLIAGSGGSAAWATQFGSDSGGNLDADPLFVAAGAAQAVPTTRGDYRLQAGSPAIDAGSADYVAPFVLTDLAGQDRISGDKPDLGAYEFSPSSN